MNKNRCYQTTDIFHEYAAPTFQCTRLHTLHHIPTATAAEDLKTCTHSLFTQPPAWHSLLFLYHQRQGSTH